MLYSISDIVRDAKIALRKNPNTPPMAINALPQQLTLDDILASRIVDAVRRAHLDAPLHLLDTGCNFADAVYWRDDGSGWVLLPQDFLRLIAFQMDDWLMPVNTAITADHPLYCQQRSPWPGLRGNPERPVCAIVHRPEGLALEFYTCRSANAQVKQAVYLPQPAIQDDHIYICQSCYQLTIQNIVTYHENNIS